MNSVQQVELENSLSEKEEDAHCLRVVCGVVFPKPLSSVVVGSYFRNVTLPTQALHSLTLQGCRFHTRILPTPITPKSSPHHVEQANFFIAQGSRPRRRKRRSGIPGSTTTTEGSGTTFKAVITRERRSAKAGAGCGSAVRRMVATRAKVADK